MREYTAEEQSQAFTGVAVQPSRPRARQRAREFIGDRIMKMRIALGLSQEEVAQRAGLKRYVVSDIEAGRSCQLTSLEYVAGAVGLRVELHCTDRGGPDCRCEEGKGAASVA